MKKVLFLVLTIMLITFNIPNVNVNAASNDVKWGKINLTKEMIGKVIVKKNTIVYKKDLKTNKYIKGTSVKKGQEFGVYKLDYMNYYSIGKEKYLKASDVKYTVAPKSLTDKVRKEQNFLFKALLNSKTYELYAGDYVMGLQDDNTKLYLGFQTPTYGDALFYKGTITKIEKDKVTFNYLESYTDIKRTGTAKLSKYGIVLEYIDNNGAQIVMVLNSEK
ncbi:hypothetical protein V7056_05045 [Bacillus sp. JJ664]